MKISDLPDYIVRLAPLFVPIADRAAVVCGDRYPLLYGRPVTGALREQIREALAYMLLG